MFLFTTVACLLSILYELRLTRFEDFLPEIPAVFADGSLKRFCCDRRLRVYSAIRFSVFRCYFMFADYIFGLFGLSAVRRSTFQFSSFRFPVGQLSMLSFIQFAVLVFVVRLFIFLIGGELFRFAILLFRCWVLSLYVCTVFSVVNCSAIYSAFNVSVLKLSVYQLQ